MVGFLRAPAPARVLWKKYEKDGPSEDDPPDKVESEMGLIFNFTPENEKPGEITRLLCIVPREDATEHAINEDVCRFGFDVEWWS